MSKDDIAVEQLIFITVKELNRQYADKEKLKILYALSTKVLDNFKLSYINEELLKDNVKKIKEKLGLEKEKVNRLKI